MLHLSGGLVHYNLHCIKYATLTLFLTFSTFTNPNQASTSNAPFTNSTRSLVTFPKTTTSTQAPTTPSPMTNSIKIPTVILPVTYSSQAPTTHSSVTNSTQPPTAPSYFLPTNIICSLFTLKYILPTRAWSLCAYSNKRNSFNPIIGRRLLYGCNPLEYNFSKECVAMYLK